MKRKFVYKIDVYVGGGKLLKRKINIELVMNDVCYFLIGRVSQDIDEGSQECLLWKLKDSQNPFCKVVDAPSIILESNLYIFDGDKARKKCICCEKDAIKGTALLREFEILYG